MIRPYSASQPTASPRSSAPLTVEKKPLPTDDVQFGGTRFDLKYAREATQAQALSLAAKLADAEFVPDELLVKVQGTLSVRGVDDLAADYGAKATRFDMGPEMLESMGGQLLKLKLPAGLSVPEALAAMSRDTRIAAADTNDILRLPRNEETPPQDPAPPQAPVPKPLPNDLHQDLWGLQNTGQANGTAGIDIKAAAAWQVTTGTRTGPIIAVIDTGIDAAHPDLAKNMWTNPGELGGDGIDNDGNGVVDDVYGYSGINNSGMAVDENGHGTHCAGTIGAEGNNGAGVVGVNWETQLMALRFLGADGSGTTEDAIKCMLYATKMGARITSNSWSGDKYNAILYDALKNSPALHVIAAGNDGYDNDIKPVYPASYMLDNCITVAAHDRKDALAKFSNRGEKSVHLAAPGVDIFSTKPGNQYQTLSGTSMATPHVAGVAGLIASRWPEASNEDIKRRILCGVDQMPAPFNQRMITGGRLNAEKALEIDTVPPAMVGDLQARQVNPTGLNLTWTAPGDDGHEGRAVDYELRYSDSPIVLSAAGKGEVAFGDAVRVQAPKPGVAGATEGVQVTLPPSGQQRELHFAMRALDNVGNHSELVNLQVKVPSVPVAFEDNMNGSAQAWTAEGQWTQVAEPGRGRVWTDSPDGDYPLNSETSLVSKTISLKNFKGAKLYYDEKHDIEVKHDGLHVEVYGKKFWGGTKWRELEKLDGIAAWNTHIVDLSEYDGQDIKLRFRLSSDDSRQRDGVYLDNVVVTGARS